MRQSAGAQLPVTGDAGRRRVPGCIVLPQREPKEGARVSTLQERVPPADLRDIQLTYAHARPWWYTADDALVTWHVSADTGDDNGPGDHVGDLDITLIGDEVSEPALLLDGFDAELGHVAEVLFGDGQLDPDLDEDLEAIGTQILILHHVRLAPSWRGFGLGPLLAGSAIKTLSSGARAVVVYPAPLNEPTGATPDGYDDDTYDQAVTALQQTWAQLGFEHFRDGVYILDLGLVTLDDRLGQLSRAAERHSAR